MAGETPSPKPQEGVTKPRTPERPTVERADALVDQTEQVGDRLIETDAASAARLKKERPPGFARLPETTEEARLLEGLTAQEQMELLADFFKEQLEKPLTPQQKLAMLQLAFLETLTEQLAQGVMLASLRHFRESSATHNPYKLREWFKENKSNLSLAVLRDGHFKLPPDMQKIMEDFSGIRLDSLKTEQAIYAQYGRMIEELRSKEKYQEAEALMEQLLDPELKAGRKKLGETWTHQIKAEADREVFELYRENQDAWRAAFREQFSKEYAVWHNAPGDAGPAPDVSEARVEKAVMDYYDGLRALAHEHALNKRVVAFILDQKIPLSADKKAIYDQYVDMLDPKKEWLNLTDENLDTIIREVAINAPLIIASGGVASLARRGLSEVTVEWLAREGARRLPVLWGKKFAEKTLLSRVVSGTARVSAGLLTEGAVFDTMHHALTLEMYHDLPDWGRSMLWSALTLGVFHGTGKLSERIFTKTIGGLRYDTWLGEKIGGNITNKAVREAVRTLALKGHVEMATMLAIGAMQHAAYKGSLDEFWNNIGTEILHAYVSVGALKISGKMAQKIRALHAARRYTPEELTERAKQEKGKVDQGAVQQKLQDTQVSRGEKRRIRKAIAEDYPEFQALTSHKRSVFSEKVPDTLVAEGKSPEDVAGWIEADGKIHYSSQYFEKNFEVKLTQKNGKNIFVAGGREMTPLKFFRTADGRTVLDAMKRIKNHEVTHRLLEAGNTLSGGRLARALTQYFEGKSDLGGAREWRDVQEFLCEVAEWAEVKERAERRREIPPQHREAILRLIRENGEGLEGFDFDAVRRLDTDRLRFTTPQDLVRSAADAMHTLGEGNQYAVGEVVTIARSDGRIHQAEVIGFNEKTGDVIVRWDEQVERTREQLDQLNPSQRGQYRPEDRVICQLPNGQTLRAKVVGFNEETGDVILTFGSRREYSIDELDPLNRTKKSPAVPEVGRANIDLGTAIRGLKVNDIIFAKGDTVRRIISVDGDSVLCVTREGSRVFQEQLSLREDLLPAGWIRDVQVSTMDPTHLDRYGTRIVKIPRRGTAPTPARLVCYYPQSKTFLTEWFENDRRATKEVELEELDSLNPLRKSGEVRVDADVTSYAERLRKAGFYMEADVLLDVESNFSELDGTDISSKSKRIEYARRLLSRTPPAPALSEASPPRDIPRRLERHEVKRSVEVMAVGDLHGTLEGYEGNLRSLGVIDRAGKWIGGNRRIVIHGDIVADRFTQGLEILSRIKRLREQARVQGGEVTVLVGNHDDFMISFLLNKGVAGGGAVDAIAVCMNHRQGLGLQELRRFGSRKLQGMQEGKSDTWERLEGERELILETMRQDPEGRKILEELCNMKIGEKINDSLFVHTNPTPAMVEMILRYGSIEAVNTVYQTALRNALLHGQPLSAQYINIANVFLSTNNRKNFDDPHLADQLRNLGINQILYGHTDEAGVSHFNVGGVAIIPVDHSAFKSGEDDNRRSIAVIPTDADIRVGADQTPIFRHPSYLQRRVAAR